jgi:hypothetical protein
MLHEIGHVVSDSEDAKNKAIELENFIGQL